MCPRIAEKPPVRLMCGLVGGHVLFPVREGKIPEIISKRSRIMINITLKIARIDYDKSVETLLPQLVKEAAAKENPNGLEQFLVKLGRDTVPVVRKMLGYMDDSLKDGLVVWVTENQQPRIAETVNQQLAGVLGDSVMKIGALFAEDRPGTELALYASRIETDYAALLDSPLASSALGQMSGGGLMKGAAKFALSMASKASPDALEKQAISLLTSDRVKPKILGVMSDSLKKIGLEAELGDMTVQSVNVTALPMRSEKKFPPELKDKLMDSAAALLRDNLK